MPDRRTLLAVAVLLPWAAWAIVRTGGLDRGHPFVAALAFTPYAAATSVLPVLLAAALRRWRVAAAGVTVAALLAGAVVPRALGDGRVPAGADGPTLRVMSANVFVGRADMEAVLRLAVRLDADVVSLQELTPQALAAFDAAGGKERFPGRAVEPLRGAAGTGLVSRWTLEDPAPDDATAAAQPDALLRRPGAQAIRIKAVHPQPPISSRSEPRWEASLARMPRPEAGAAPRVLVGDFNATLDHSALRSLIDGGYVDAADATGNGLVPTWRQSRRLPLTIDRVLLDERLGVRDLSVHRIPGSDHRAVVAELVLPRG